MVERLKNKYAIELEWRPFYLYWDTPPEGRDLPDHVKRARASGSEELLSQMANAYGMKFVSTKRIYNTRLAHEATEYAREHGKANEFHKVIFRKVYTEEQDLSQWDVLRSAAQEVGLNADEMQHEVESGKYTANVEAQVQRAYQIGVSGVPTYVLNDRYAVVGAQPYDVFVQVIERLMSERGWQSDE